MLSKLRKHLYLLAFFFGCGLLILGYAVDGHRIITSLGLWSVALAALAYAFKKRSLTISILVSMIVGVVIGAELPLVALEGVVLFKIFLKLIKCIIAPLIFSTLVVGIAGHTSIKGVWRLAVKSLIYFEVVTTIALALGLAAINLSQAGTGVSQPSGLETTTSSQAMNGSEILLHAFPENIAKSVAEGQILQVVVFAVIFAVALAGLSEEYKRPLIVFCQAISKTMFSFTEIVMLFAPVGVASAIAYTVAQMGPAILVTLAKAVLTFYLAIAVFIVFVLLPIALFAKIPLMEFTQAIATPISIAFATTSSEAALPRAMKAMEEMGCPEEVVAFVIPTGYSMNLDGTSLYLSMAAIFVAQAADIPLSLGEQIWIVITLMLASKGVAGVPRASLIILLGMASSFGLPEWPIMVLMGVDVIMDMGRTSLNVLGNCLATLVVARWEGLYRPNALPVISPDMVTPPLPEAELPPGGGDS